MSPGSLPWMNHRLFWLSGDGLRLLSSLERRAPALVAGRIPPLLARLQAFHVAYWLQQHERQANGDERLAR